MENKEKNFISAIIYVNNSEHEILPFLSGLNSLLKSSFYKYEIIVVDDYSTDRTNAIIKKIANEEEKSVITILKMSHRQGKEASMNAGIDLSIGDFVLEFESMNVDFSWQLILKVYQTALEGFDIVSASSNAKRNIKSSLFYLIFNKYANIQHELNTESFRIISRRGINRVNSISDKYIYRKALYANCGLKYKIVKYKSLIKTAYRKGYKETDLAINSLIIFTDVAYQFTKWMSIIMIFSMILNGALSLLIPTLYNNILTPIILFLSFSFLGIFIILAMILKYLSLLIKQTFNKKNYLFESIEKL